jgi:hypothetical protein
MKREFDSFGNGPLNANWQFGIAKASRIEGKIGDGTEIAAVPLLGCLSDPNVDPNLSP